VLHRITLESEAAVAGGAYSLILTDNVHLDASGAVFVPDVTNNNS